MFSIKTRSRSLDYSIGAFNPDISNLWLKKYQSQETKLNYIRDDSKIDIYFETDEEKWHLYFGKIPTDRRSSAGQTIYTSIIGEGLLSDVESKNLVFKLLANVFAKTSPENSIKNQIAPVFEKYFTEKTINNLDGKREDTYTSKLVNEKIISFINELPEIENTEIIDSNNLEFNNYEKKACIENIISILYGIIFSRKQNYQCFICTSTKLSNAEKRNQIISCKNEIYGIVLTTNDDSYEEFPIKFNNKQAESNNILNPLSHVNSFDDAQSISIKFITWLKKFYPKLLFSICILCISALKELNDKKNLDKLKQEINNVL